MSAKSVFDWVCAELEAETELNSLESRGTIRIALKNAGLEAASVSADEMKILLHRVLPAELQARAVENAASLCTSLAERLGKESFESAPRESAEAVFARLGSRK